MRVAFWNIEKGNRLPNQSDPASNARSKALFAYYTITQNWSPSFDVLILAEVTDSQGHGENFVKAIANQLSTNGQMFCGEFFMHRTKAGRKSVCNMGVIWRETDRNLTGLGNRIDFYWEPDYVRPIMILPAGKFIIGGIHAKSANYPMASKEVTETCTYLARQGKQAMLIGDMNIRFDNWTTDDANYLHQIDYRKIAPGIDPTFKSHKKPGEPFYYEDAVLDYAWADFQDCRAYPLREQYGGWEYIDHAPIQYELGIILHLRR